MAQDIVGSLFGVNPNAIMDQRMNAEMNQAINFANLSPAQQANYGGFLAGQMLGRGVGGLLGAQDPALQQASVLREAQQQGFDVTTPEGLQQLAQFFVQRGQPGLASQVAQQMQSMQKSSLDYTKASEDYQREKAFREAVAALPPEQRTEDNIMQLAAQYGTTSTVMSALANLTGKREAIMARQEAAQIKADEKKAAQEEKTKAANASALAAVMPVMSTIEQAIPLVGWNTAGWGSFMKFLPGTDAKDLSGYIDTIKANLGFQQLQAMRQASPTGGALGQVAVKELEALQSTIANLDPAQKPETLTANLKKVQTHYQNWKKTLEQQLGQENTPPVPSKAEFMQKARQDERNKQYSDAELSAYYDTTYGGK